MGKKIKIQKNKDIEEYVDQFETTEIKEENKEKITDSKKKEFLERLAYSDKENEKIDNEQELDENEEDFLDEDFLEGLDDKDIEELMRLDEENDKGYYEKEDRPWEVKVTRKRSIPNAEDFEKYIKRYNARKDAQDAEEERKQKMRKAIDKKKQDENEK